MKKTHFVLAYHVYLNMAQIPVHEISYGDQEFEVELIMAKRKNQKGDKKGYQWLVKYAGYPFHLSYWNRIHSLKNCPESLKEYEDLSRYEKNQRNKFLKKWDELDDDEQDEIGILYMDKFYHQRKRPHYFTPYLTPASSRK